MTPLYLPPPPIRSLYLGPLTIHLYALCLLAGIVVAWVWAGRRVASRGVDREVFESMALWIVLAGVLGARLYHVITDHQLYFGPGRNPVDALKIWHGGLGVWGAVIVGFLVAWLLARRRGWSIAELADCLAPPLLVAQAIGRIGNWFNQELFGRPSTLPWALRVDPQYRPAGYEQYETFHPTFGYELIWNLLGAGVLIWAERRYRLGRGKLFALYVVWYTLGRSFIEALRIDPANTLGGLRVNNVVALITFVGGLVALIWLARARPGRLALPFGAPPVRTGATRQEHPAGDHPDEAAAGAEDGLREASTDRPTDPSDGPGL